MPDALTIDELLSAVELVDAHLDANTSEPYRDQPLASHWSRVTKVCEEAGEVWKALSNLTGENPRKGVCGTLDDLLGELGDTASAAICAIQHMTKDTDQTWRVVSAALIKARNRVEAAASPVHVELGHVEIDFEAGLTSRREAERRLVAAGCTQGAAELHVANICLRLAIKNGDTDGEA